MLISQDVSRALISSPLIITPLLSHPLSLTASCPFWDAPLPALPLCSTMRMGGMPLSDGLHLARHRNEPEIDLWVGDALPSTVLLLCILFKSSMTR